MVQGCSSILLCFPEPCLQTTQHKTLRTGTKQVTTFPLIRESGVWVFGRVRDMVVGFQGARDAQKSSKRCEN